MNQTTDNPKQALIDRLKASKNILVTVSADPTVDQLAACLGLTLWLNKAGKHATAVFSGVVPSTLEFLQPDETLEKNTDSLRDFIIALDKTKADKLRYKVEDNVVKIFITPYRTTLTADDLEYSQGDFNIDTVVALGVSKQEDLDTAVTAHGRILHDATVATITTGDEPSELGSVQWHDSQASSLCELVVELGNKLDAQQLDNQIATALLTGVVAQTERFSNEKTTPQTMSLSAQLMSAGANQQLVASKLEESAPEPAPAAEPEAVEPPKQDGEIDIEHEAGETPAADDDYSLPEPSEPSEPGEPAEPEAPAEEPAEEAVIEDEKQAAPDQEPLVAADDDSRHVLTEPPQLGGQLTANSQADDVMLEPTSDALSQQTGDRPLLDHDTPGQDQPPTGLTPPPPSWMPQQAWMDPAADPAQADRAPDSPVADQPQPVADQPAPDVQPPVAEPDSAQPQPAPADFTLQPDETLAEIEQAVGSPHVTAQETPVEAAVAEQEAALPDVDSARDEVMKAIESAPETMPPEPVEALNAQPIDLNPPVADQPVQDQPEPAADQPAQDQTVPADQPTLPPYPTGNSTAFDPAAFGVENDTEVLTPAAPTPPAPADPVAPDPELTGPVDQPFTMPLPNALNVPPANPVPPTSVAVDPAAPPPVPPPLPFTPGQQQ